MPIVSILRKYEPNLMYRRIGVYLDGKNIGNFPKGESREIDLPTGHHQLKAKTKWYGSKELNFTLFNKEKKSFVISTNKFLIRSLAIFALIDIFLFIAGRIYHPDPKFISVYKTIAGVMFVIIAGYFFTIGRSNYLIIKEKGAE